METLSINGAIGEAVTAEYVLAELARIGPVPLTVKINSQGGSVSEGVAIYEALRQHPGAVTVEVVGWALSIASVIAMAGKNIRMASTALVMMHNPWVTATGNAGELRKTADTLDLVGKTLLRAYARCGQSEAKLRAWMEAETWFDAEQAVKAGLADEVIGEPATELAGANACAYRIPPHIQERIYAMQTATSLNEAQIRARALAEDSARRAEIRSSFSKFSAGEGVAALMNSCMEDVQCSAKDANAKLLAHIGARCAPIAGNYVVTHDGGTSEFMAAACDTLLMRAGIPVADPHPAVVDLKRFSIATMAERILSMHGIAHRELGKAELIQAALSTSDFPKLLANVGGKALRAGYEMAPATHAVWTAEREVADFKPQSLVALSFAPDLEKVPEHAEYKFGKFSEAAESFSVETFGKIVAISRQALVNDDLGAFTRIPQAYGASARRLEADLCYAKLTGNPAMSDGVALFHADHGNLAAAGAAISVASLGLARAAMRSQKGLDGIGYFDPQPRFLIVPVFLETTAEALLASLVDPSKNNDATNPAWVRGLTLVADPRLDAASTSAWYLAADPNQVETVIRAYLAGSERPYLEEDDAFIRDVISHKARLDVGVGVIDSRGLYKNPGV
jgi:ATP-dependent protease ClpP protease subunit